MVEIKTMYLCVDDNNDIVAHAVETDNNIVIGDKLCANRKSRHELAKDIQRIFHMSPFEHARRLNDAIIVNEEVYQDLLDSCTPITWEEAVEQL